jgi:hypothetical protein
MVAPLWGECGIAGFGLHGCAFLGWQGGTPHPGDFEKEAAND